MSNPTLSIVLPCFNPPNGWAENILKELAWLTESLPQETMELLILNDGTPKEKLGNVLFEQESRIAFIQRNYNRGKGFTVRDGVRKAKGEKIIYTDIDFPYTRESFLAVLKALEKGDIAIGVRSVDYYQNMPKARVIVSKSLRWMIRLFLQIPTDDTQCGLKGFNQRGKEVFLETTIDRYLFDLEFIFLAARKELAIQKVPVKLSEGVVLTTLDVRIVFSEMFNFLKIYLFNVIMQR